MRRKEMQVIEQGPIYSCCICCNAAVRAEICEGDLGATVNVGESEAGVIRPANFRGLSLVPPMVVWIDRAG